MKIDELHKAGSELFGKIRELNRSISHQRKTLDNWIVKDTLLQNKEEYRERMFVDIRKLDKLKSSYTRVLMEIVDEL